MEQERSQVFEAGNNSTLDCTEFAQHFIEVGLAPSQLRGREFLIVIEVAPITAVRDVGLRFLGNNVQL